MKESGASCEGVPRPALPPILWCSAIFWVGCALGLQNHTVIAEGLACAASLFGLSVPESSNYQIIAKALFGIVLLVALGAVGGISLRRRRTRKRISMLVFLTVFLVAGFILSALFIASLNHTREVLLSQQEAMQTTASPSALQLTHTAQATFGQKCDEPSNYWAEAERALQETDKQTSDNENLWYYVRILDDPRKSLYGYTVTAEIRYANEGAHYLATRYRVRLYLDSNDCGFGDELRAQINLKCPSERALSSCNTKGIALVGTLVEVEQLDPSTLGIFAQLRSGFSKKIDTLLAKWQLNTDSIALLKALILGDRTMLFDTTLYQEVRVVGLAHLVAVSGAHLVIVTSFLALILKAFRLSRKVSLCIQIGFLGVYLIMVGFPVSCLRAGCMSLFSLLAFTSARRSSALSGLGVVVALFIALDPSTALSLSFTLSVLATLGIIVFMPLFSSWITASSQSVQTMVCDPVSMTIAALLFTFPVSAAVFAQCSLVVPLANIMATPLITFICGVGTMAFVLAGVPIVGEGILLMAYAGGLGFKSVMDAFMTIPGIALPVDVSLPWCALLACVVAILLWILWPQRVKGARCIPKVALGAAAIAVVAILVIPLLLPRLDTEVVMLDVGQGDAFLVRSEGESILIDTGNQATKLYAALARHGVRSLDAVVITHADDDHCGCLSDLRGMVACDSVIVAEGMSDVSSSKTDELMRNATALVGEDQVSEVAAGDELHVGALVFKVLHPEVLMSEGGNDDSVCLLMESDINHDGEGEWSGLFCGDAEAEVLESLVSEGMLGKVDLYKVGHHGSKAALNEDLVQTLHPRIALVSVGADNSYGHPSEFTLSLLNSVGASILRSDEQGDVVCSLQTDSIKVSPMR